MKPPRLKVPQLPLQLDAANPDAAARWRDGTCVPYLGGTVTLQLDTACREAMLDGNTLHLPLPPEATPRQIQDAAEAWLRKQVAGVIAAAVGMTARGMARPAPRISFSFAARGNWWQADAHGGLRFHWRLIEQSEAVIVQAVRQALANLPLPATEPDLFALAV